MGKGSKLIGGKQWIGGHGPWWLIIGLTAFVLAGCKQSVTVPAPVPYSPDGTLAPTPVSTRAPPQPSVQSPASVPEERLAATVNGRPIYVRDYEQQVAEWEAAFASQNENLDAEEKQAMLIQGRRQVLDVMIEQALIEEAAAREGVSLTDAEVESVVARDIEDNGGLKQFEVWLQANNWTYDEYKARQAAMMLASQMFERVTRNVPTKAEQVHARHILVAAEADARSILGQLQGGADFAEIARQHSLDPSTKESGGDLGFFPRGTLVVPQVEEATFSLPVGHVGDVVQSAMGYHIVQVLERVQDRQLAEESWQALKEVTFRRWISELWEAAEIEIHIAL